MEYSQQAGLPADGLNTIQAQSSQGMVNYLPFNLPIGFRPVGRPAVLHALRERKRKQAWSDEEAGKRHKTEGMPK